MECPVVLGDCTECLKSVPSNSVHLALVDPPYNISVKGGEEWDTIPHHRYMEWTRLWVYSQGGDARLSTMKKYATRLEMLEWFVKAGAPHTFNVDGGTTPYTEAEKRVALAKGTGRVLEASLDRGKPPKNWVDIPRENSRSKERQWGAHPSMKPLTLCNLLVAVHSNVGETVLVPFAGSGSECVAVLSQGRQLVAFEKEKQYHDICSARLAAKELSSTSVPVAQKKKRKKQTNVSDDTNVIGVKCPPKVQLQSNIYYYLKDNQHR